MYQFDVVEGHVDFDAMSCGLTINFFDKSGVRFSGAVPSFLAPYVKEDDADGPRAVQEEDGALPVRPDCG